MTYDSCYGCNTRNDLIHVWGKDGRSFPVCKQCHENIEEFKNLEVLQ
jgi:hypothetical protein